MSRADRLSIIRELEEKSKSPVIAYITGDRPNLSTKIAPDAVRILKAHLDNIGYQKKISLFLYTRGGDLMTSFRVVKLFREYCDELFVQIPFRAHSGGTLISIGANGIIMGKLAELTPVDPSTANHFNPTNPINPMEKLPISVEDVTAYLSLAREKAKLKEDNMPEVFRMLSDKINPVALGNVHRVYNVIRELIPKILSLHMNSEDKEKIEFITNMLTEKLYTHDYTITRDEAERIGLKVVKPDEELEKTIWNLYEAYEKDLRLTEPFNPIAILDSQQTAPFSHEIAYIESVSRCDALLVEGDVVNQPAQIQLGQQIIQQPGLPIVKVKSQKWKII